MTNLMPTRCTRHPLTRAAYNPFEDDFFRPFFAPTEQMNDLRVDVKDEGESYLLEADLPGFKKEDISLEITDGVLTISAESREEKKEEEPGKYLFNERRTRAYKRSFTLNGIDEERISASCENGVLKLTLPKEVEQPKTGRRIEIGE